jgi:hypothetical protein
VFFNSGMRMGPCALGSGPAACLSGDVMAANLVAPQSLP